MHRTRIKICGITRPQDAAAAARLGADAIGVVLHSGSKRGVTKDMARRIVSVLPPFVSPVAVFVDEDPQEVLNIAAELNVRHVQLNGDESPHDVAELRGLSVLKAIRVESNSFPRALDVWREAIADMKLDHLVGLVLETASGKPGGSGVENDWQTIRAHRAAGAFKGLPPIITAGGLNPQNVAAVVRDLRPWAVDVSSGVESVVGQKSEEQIEAFIGAVGEADRS